MSCTLKAMFGTANDARAGNGLGARARRRWRFPASGQKEENEREMKVTEGTALVYCVVNSN